MQRVLDLLFCCCIPFVGIAEEVCGGVGDMKMEEEFLGGGGGHRKLISVTFSVQHINKDIKHNKWMESLNDRAVVGVMAV